MIFPLSARSSKAFQFDRQPTLPHLSWSFWKRKNSIDAPVNYSSTRHLSLLKARKSQVI